MSSVLIELFYVFTVLRNVLWPQRRDAQTGEFLIIIFFSSFYLMSRNNVEKSQTFHPLTMFFFLIPLRLCKFLEKGR